MSDHLGKISFLDTPDVNGADVLTSTTLSTQLTNLVVPGTEGLTLPNGTTAQRAVTPQTGEERYNTTLGAPEVYYNGTWLPYGKVIQSVAGNIAASTGSVTAKSSTVGLPTTTDRGLLAFTTTFTPLVAGSNLVIQYIVTASHSSTTARALYTSVWVNTTCQGVALGGGVVAQGTTVGVGAVNMSMQVVYQTPSTAALTIAGYVGHILGTTTAQTVNINQVGASGTFGGALANEFRILEII